MRRNQAASILIQLILIVTSLVFFMPIFLTTINAFKSMEDMTRPFYSFPRRLAFENFSQVIETTHMVNAFLTSVVVVSVSMVGIVVLSSMASYAIVRHRSVFNQIVYVALVSGIMIPFSVIMIPLMKVVGFFRVGNVGGLIVIYFALGMSLPVFLLTGFIRGSVPLELEESAHIDGAGNLRIFISIVFPLLKPIVATVVMLGTVWIFNDFLLPSLLLTSKRFTIPLSQYQLSGQYLQWWNLMLAGFTLTLLPIIVLFLSFQKYFIKGVTEGALKG